ncbi:hypothetical protein D3C71_1594830 [compost metagenome]
MGHGQAVRRARVHLQRGVGHDLRRQPARRIDRHDLVVIAMHHQRGHVDLLQVLRVVHLGELADAVVLPLVAALHALQPEGVAHALADLVPVTVGPEERRGQVLVEL